MDAPTSTSVRSGTVPGSLSPARRATDVERLSTEQLDILVIGGGVAQIGELWWEALESSFRESAPSLLRSTPILPAKLGLEAVLLGAAMLAWDKATS